VDPGVAIGIGGVVVTLGVGWWQVAAARDRPRPHFAIAGEPSGEELPARVSNTGGAAVKCHALAHSGTGFYEFRGGVPAQSSEQEISMKRLGEARTEAEAPFIHWTVAADGRKRWWDARRGRRIRRPINKWLKKRSLSAGLPIPVEIP
jgi:hypothetical protein